MKDTTCRRIHDGFQSSRVVQPLNKVTDWMSGKSVSELFIANNFFWSEILRVCIVSKMAAIDALQEQSAMSTTPHHQSFWRLPLSKPSDYSKQILILNVSQLYKIQNFDITFLCVIPLVIKFVAASIINMCTKLFSAHGKKCQTKLISVVSVSPYWNTSFVVPFWDTWKKENIVFCCFSAEFWPKNHHLLKKGWFKKKLCNVECGEL